VTELHEALVLWAQARMACAAAVRAPFVDPSSEPFLPLV
jgi:hypothetical protein